MYVSQKRRCTIGDIIDVLSDIELTPESLEQISSLIEKEWFLYEERFGGIDIVTSQLNGLNQFITEKFIPMLMCGWFNDTDDNPRSFLLKYLKENVSEETKSSQLFYASCSNISAVLSH
ncbi:MAG: hypothetical protein ACTSUO_01940 [Candidatus Thorarchaeota archaeon]